MKTLCVPCRPARSLRLAVAALPLTLALLSPPSVTAQTSAGEVRPGIWRLDGIDPDLPGTDLAPLRQILEGAQVVGLGESYHTSGGFYQVKHRIFRHLVEEMGFRAIAFETPWDRARAASHYVATCEGTAADAARGFYQVWQSEEVTALLDWMCAWNQAHPGDPVHFFGFDIRQPYADGPALIDFLRGQGEADGDSLITGLRQCDGVEISWYPQLVPEATHQACLASLDEVDRRLDALDGSGAVQTSREEVEWLKIRANGLRANENKEYWEPRDYARSFEARDRGMATNFERIRALTVGSARTAIWAHNGHVAKFDPIMPYRTLGAYLDEDLGHRYAAVALTAFRTGVNWNVVGCGYLPNFAASFDRRVRPLGEPYLLIDLDFNGTGPAHPPYLDPNALAVMAFDVWRPGTQFDAAVYLEHSPPMRALLWSPTCS